MRRSPSTWLTIADTAVPGALTLSSAALVSPHRITVGRSWIIPFVSFAGVALQYWSRPLPGALCGAGLAAAMTAGTVLALPPGASSPSIVSAIWALVLCLLGRILWTLANRAGRKAAEIASQLEESRTAQQVAAAVRADRRALDDALQDMADSTLLIVCFGMTRVCSMIAGVRGRYPARTRPM